MKLTDIKIIFSDLDGTIVRADNTISSKTAEKIRELQNQGIIFMPCTGRSYRDMLSCFPADIKMPAILLNGALYVDQTGKDLYHRALTKAQINMICDTLLEKSAPAILFAQSRLYYYGNIEDIQQCFATYFNEDPIHMGDIIEINDLAMIKEDIMKIETMTCDANKRLACMEALGQEEELLVSSSLPFNVEITPKLVHKGAMAAYVVEQLGYQKEEVLIFGDSDNDYQLFQAFPHSVAMENASSHIKEIARYHAVSCEEDGVALFLDTLS